MAVGSPARPLLHALSLLALCLLLPAAAQNAASSPQAIHVAVRVFNLNNEPLKALNAGNFHLALAGRASLPFRLEKPPVHLLVLLSDGQGDLGRPLQDSLIRELTPLWKAGWWISVHDAQGRQTPYLADASALRSAIGGAIAVRAPVPAAVGTLAEFTGRRVIFVVTGPSFDVDDSTIRLAHQYHAMLYQIGTPRSNRFNPESTGEYGQYTVSTGHDDVLGATTFYWISLPPTPPTPFLHTEKSFRAADRHALVDGMAFYDLAVDLPADVRTLDLSLHLTDATENQYRVQAQPYADYPAALPRLTIDGH